MSLVLLIASSVRGREPVLVLVLAGVVVGALAGSAISLLKVLADPYDQLPAITFWLLGSLAAIKLEDLWTTLPVAALGLVPLVLLRWRINVLSLGDEEAKALGVNAARLRIVVIAAATLMTASVVAIAGIIGWVGLIMPHMARMLVGPELRPPAAGGDAARRGLPSAGRHARPHARRGRDPDRHPHRLRRRAGVPLAAGARPARLGMRLEALHLGFGYPGKPVGRDVDLAVDAGEVVCLLGPNGSGKTTLFKTLLGLLPAQAGEVRIAGRPLLDLPRVEIARQIAYVPQAHAAHFPYAVLDMVLMGRTAHLGPFAQPGPRDRAAALEALTTLGIADLAAADYTRISGGQRQLALIARALAQAAPLIVMDEPTASLDFGNQALVLREVRALAARGYGIVLSTHDPDHAFACARRVALLHGGRLMAQGAPAEVLTAARLEQVYGVPVLVERLASGHTVCAPNLT